MNSHSSGEGRRSAASAIVVSVTAVLTGCGALVSNPAFIGRAGEPSSPLTPEQSRAQVLEAAREIVAGLDVPVLEAYFWRSGCGDRGGPPFRGEIRIAYPRAAPEADPAAELDAMIERLADSGWHPDPDFRSHSPAVSRDGVVVVFRKQTPGIAVRNIYVVGQCRDVAPERHGDGPVEPITVR